MSSPLFPTIFGSKTYTESVEGKALMLVGHLSSPENPSLTVNFTFIAIAALRDDIAKIMFFLWCLAHKIRDFLARHKIVGFHVDLI